MECIFPNLYRFTDFWSKGRRYGYLVVRREGNLLLHGFVSSLYSHFEDIDKLGGVDLQFITHYHDLNPEFHEKAYDRFGCKLCYHKAAGAKVRERTNCPSNEFGNHGLQLGSDFEVVYFPGHTRGHSVHRWCHQRKEFLFSGHVMKLVDGNWELFFNPTVAPIDADFDDFIETDFLLPTSSYFGEEEYHTFIEQTRAVGQVIS
jgi:hypothetical protein